MVAVERNYKTSEVGLVPDNWEIKPLEELCKNKGLVRGPFGGTLKKEFFVKDGIKVYEQQNAIYGDVNLGDYYIDINKFEELKRFEVKPNDFIVSCSGTIGKIFLIPNDAPKGVINQALLKITTDENVVSKHFFLHYFEWDKFQTKIIDSTQGGAMKNLVGMSVFRETKFAVPSLPEQTAIATALSDTDALIENLEKLIAKKRNIKQGLMQELLTGNKRLSGFSGEWGVKTLSEVIDCLDNLRIPLNDTQRASMKGDYPYCGANGVLDYINDYCFDDDIILIAEDGGYFDEYFYRPIAYRMSCKCWVNNHAHVLKVKAAFNQDYIFYSLVHKNIMKFLTSGTRAKLNKSELYNIEIQIPKDKEEQDAISKIFNDIDIELNALDLKHKKSIMIKQGMMQALLTGKIRLL